MITGRKREEWAASLWLHVCGIHNRQAAGTQTLFNNTVQDRKGSCCCSLVSRVIGNHGAACVGRHDFRWLEVLLGKRGFARPGGTDKDDERPWSDAGHGRLRVHQSRYPLIVNGSR